ncbi:hypothetical protein ABK249_22830 [Neorhizobium sp. Rsf11]|uniref:Uncharacterized protein n=1 Tax=Neorhizobium phenanthreniclasticum TaxID=3157917 RepID=A0ABV0M796_9HYPH
METEDDLLMREINAFADRAEENKFSHADIKAIAMTLSAHFTHRTVDEIEAKLKDVWRSRDLYWMG